MKFFYLFIFIVSFLTSSKVLNAQSKVEDLLKSSTWIISFKGYKQDWKDDTVLNTYTNTSTFCDSNSYFSFLSNGILKTEYHKDCVQSNRFANCNWEYNSKENYITFLKTKGGDSFPVIISKDEERLFLTSRMIGIESGVVTTTLYVFQKTKNN